MEISPLPRFLVTQPSRLLIKFATECVSAGFPSPADDYIDIDIDLNEYLIRHPISTFLLRVSGNSMTGAGIHNNDLLIVDRSIEPHPGHIVVAVLDGSFILKRLVLKRGIPYLEADNSEYASIDLRQYNDVQIWGVAIHSIHSLNLKHK